MSNAENQSLPETNPAVQNSRQKHFLHTRQPSEGTELAELLAEHQERQLRSMQGLNVGVHRKWGSSSRINELHLQTNTTHQSINTNGLRHLEQMPLNNGTTMPVSSGYGISGQSNQQVIHAGEVYMCVWCSTSLNFSWHLHV